MRKYLSVIFLLAMFILPLSFTLAADDCKQELLPKATSDLLKPFLEVVILNWGKKYDAEPEQRGIHLMDKILNDKTIAGDRAISYLLFVYTGEHYGEEFLCEAIIRGRRMLPIIEQYKLCLPLTGLEPLPSFLTGSGVLVKEAVKEIESGKTCTHVER